MASGTFEPLKGLGGLRDSVNRLIEDGLSAVGGGNVLPVDIYETDTAVVIKAGPIWRIEPEGIDVSITADVLTIKGVTKSDDEVSEERYLRRERKFGPFSRAVKIPRNVRANEAVADFKDNILIVTLPKVEEAQPKVINIRTANS